MKMFAEVVVGFQLGTAMSQNLQRRKIELFATVHQTVTKSPNFQNYGFWLSALVWKTGMTSANNQNISKIKQFHEILNTNGVLIITMCMFCFMNLLCLNVYFYKFQKCLSNTWFANSSVNVFSLLGICWYVM